MLGSFIYGNPGFIFRYSLWTLIFCVVSMFKLNVVRCISANDSMYMLIHVFIYYIYLDRSDARVTCLPRALAVMRYVAELSVCTAAARLTATKRHSNAAHARAWHFEVTATVVAARDTRSSLEYTAPRRLACDRLSDISSASFAWKSTDAVNTSKYVHHFACM